MALRTILVCLTDVDSAKDLLKSAAALARRDQTHLIGFYVSESLIVYPGIAIHVPEESYKDFYANQKTHAKQMKTIFTAQMAAEDFPSEWRQVSSGTDFVAGSIIANARNVDLVIMAQEEEYADHPPINKLHEEVIKGCGRPLLVIPRNYVAETLGENVLLGWSDTREATRAMHDLLRVASETANVRVIRVGKPPADEMADFAINDLAVTIARHGPQVEVIHRHNDKQSISDVLEHEALEMGADMLATGAFGHSRVYDFVIGAVTRDLLRTSKLPVMFSK